MNGATKDLLEQNRLLSIQVAQIRYFLNGSRALRVSVPDVEVDQRILCQAADIHHVAAGLLAPSASCYDIGPGLRPQRLLNCAVHALIEPWRPYADHLVSMFPEKLTIREFGETFLQNALDRSVDTVFLLDVIEHLEKDTGQELLRQARRVARVQVVVFTPLGFMPHHFSEVPSEWGAIEYGDLQNHRSGWIPDEFEDAVSVICEDYHRRGEVGFGAFYSIIRVNSLQGKPILHLVSSLEDFPRKVASRDMVIADVRFSELSHEIAGLPHHNLVIVPLQLIAEESTQPVEFLQGTLMNFSVLLDSLDRFEKIEAYGAAAQVVVHRHQRKWLPIT